MARKGKSVWPAVQAPPQWGIEPVPLGLRRLAFLDYFVLWADLGVGLLVLLAGSLLVPGMGLGQALLAILVGTVIGNLLLALTGVIGSDTGVPTMVLLRPVLGIRGSYLPSFFNVIQLIGWGAFEVIIMSQAANSISQRFLGFSNHLVWTAFFALLCTLFAVGGPLVVVKQWLEKFAVWLVLATTAWLTYYLFSHYNIGSLLRAPSTGEMPFWLGVDLVVAMPVSWLPLVADYNRFGRGSKGTFWGTFLGYLVANVWFYGLGALLVLALQTQDLIAAIMALASGWVALLIILVDETDNAFADIYSAAISAHNVLSRAKLWHLVVAVGFIDFLLAATIPIGNYENFLLLIGSIFVPLFGVLAADYFVLRRRHYDTDELYRAGGRYWYKAGLNWVALLAWALGIVIYHLIARLLPNLGASIPSFVAAFLLYWLFTLLAMPAESYGRGETK